MCTTQTQAGEQRADPGLNSLLPQRTVSPKGQKESGKVVQQLKRISKRKKSHETTFTLETLIVFY